VLNDTVNIACNLFIVPFLNKSKQHNLLSLAGTDMHLKRLDYGEPGFQIPTVDGVTFVNPEIVLGQGYVVVSTDFSYNSSSLTVRTHRHGETEDLPVAKTDNDINFVAVNVL
jgi:hypothetical protein